jgi:RNA polymerase sigma-70 factor, ECF subfamily
MATNPRDFIAKDLYPAHSVDRGAEDGILMERIALGDEQALMTIYERYSSLVFSLSWHVLRDQHSAEDVMQEVFLRLWRGAKKYDHKRGSLAARITVITRHLAIDRLRQRHREEQLPDITSAIDLETFRLNLAS